MRTRVLLLSALLSVVAAGAEAAPIVGTLNDGLGGSFIIGGTSCTPAPCGPFNLALGQEFIIGPQSVIVDSVTAFVGDPVSVASGAILLMQVMDLVGPGAAPANVLFSGSVAFPDTAGGRLPATIAGLNLALAANTSYFLVLSTSAGFVLDAGGSPDYHGVGNFGTQVEPFGTIGGMFRGSQVAGTADYNDLNPATGYLNFMIDGRLDAAAPVPEPATGVLVLLGIGAVALRVRLRR